MSKPGVHELPAGRPGPVVLVAPVGAAAGSRAAAAALACAGSEPDRAGLLVDLAGGRAPRPTPIATAGARALEGRLAAHLPGAAVASRGAICRVSLDLESVPAVLPLVRDSAAVLHLLPAQLQAALGDPRIRPSAALLRADLSVDRPLVALVARDLIGRGMRLLVLKRALARPLSALALGGALPAGLPVSAGQRRVLDRIAALAQRAEGAGVDDDRLTGVDQGRAR